MTTTPITRTQAAALSGRRLPAGHNWYLVTGLEWYPQFGDFSHTWAGVEGLNAIIGKRKAVKAVAA